MRNPTILDAALGYIDSGYAIAPGFSPAMIAPLAQIKQLKESPSLFSSALYYLVEKLCKIPLRPYFTLYPLTTKEQVLKWFERYKDANIHIALGRHSNIVALDTDFPSGRHLARTSETYHTRKVSTGSGFHCYFKYPNGVTWTRHITADGMYLKGDGCWMSAPPSLHANGHTYYWLDETSPIAELPSEFLTSKKALLSRLHVFGICALVHNYIFVYFVYPILKLLLSAKRHL